MPFRSKKTTKSLLRLKWIWW